MRTLGMMLVEAVNKSAYKKKVNNKIYKETQKLTSKLYSDDYWKGVDDIRKALSSVQEIIDVSVFPIDGGYKTSKDGTSQWKEYKVELETQEGIKLEGTLSCHAAGSVADPFDKYDMSLVMW